MTDEAQGSDRRPFDPWGATTGIGSLPHARVDDALDLMAATCPEVPYSPQLPTLDELEHPVLQALSPLADLVRVGRQGLETVVDEVMFVAELDGRPAVPPDRAVGGLRGFLAALTAGAFPRCRAVKGQISGPITIAGLLRVEGTSALRRPLVVPALARFLARHARWQAEALAAAGRPVLVLVDEPGLAVTGRLRLDPATVADATATVVAGVRSGGARSGLHLCGPAAAHDLAGIDADVVSLDVSRPAVTAPLDARLLAWGAVPVSGSPPVPLMAGDLLGHLALQTGDVRAGLARSLVTPACGLGLVEPAHAERTARTALDLSAHMRRLVLDGLPSFYDGA